jgi:hypothetical protein
MDYQFQYQQDRPDIVCTDRALETPEQHPPNDFYGQASVLKRYARLREDQPLPLVIEHGLRRDGKIWSNDQDALLSTLLVASNARRHDLKRLTNKRVIPIGSCFCYAKQLVDEQSVAHLDALPRQGTIVFPVHSTHWISAEFDNESFADLLLQLPKQMQPVVVCIYWKDYLQGAHEPYMRRGLKVVSAGHMFDRDFLLRFYDLCRRFKYALGNEIGTHLFYSLVSGCSYAHIPGFPVRFSAPQQFLKNRSQGAQYEASINKLHHLFSEIVSAPTSPQLAEVRRIVGTDSVRSRAGIRAIINAATHADSFRPAWLKVNTGENLFLPSRFARQVPQPLRFLLKTKRSIQKRLAPRPNTGRKAA